MCLIAHIIFSGEMAEWSKATVSKIVILLVGIEGSNPSLSAIFILKKNENGERSRKASLHCAVRHNFTQKTKFFLHIFTKPQRSLACEDASFHYACEVVPLRSTCEVFSLRE